MTQTALCNRRLQLISKLIPNIYKQTTFQEVETTK